MRIMLAVLALPLLLAVACAPRATVVAPSALPGDAQEAQVALQHFLELLNNGQYTEAVPFYGGSYATLYQNNPGISSKDVLLRQACEINGFMCLQPSSILLDQIVSSDEFVFQVQFQTKSGELFVRGPCCGASPTDQPPQSVFAFRVIRDAQGAFVILDMPPYVP